jgi:FAD/FMN-containing dehydrogenase
MNRAYDIAALRAEIGPIKWEDNPVLVKQKSRDFYWYSPMLKRELENVTADVVVSPTSESEVRTILAAAYKLGIPVTPRGAGTGNYGQAMPLMGGMLLNLAEMNKIRSIERGRVICEPGALLIDVDKACEASGQELRMFPSTRGTASVAGFVAGGSGGVGSVTYGGLREPGNILAARIVTLEEQPRVIELRGDAAQKVNRAYGTTGIITSLEMPLAPAWDWIEVVVAFADFFDAVRFGLDVALADGIVKKLISPIAWPIPSFFGAIRAHCPEGRSLVMAMVAEPSLETFKALLGRRGDITFEARFDEAPANTPLYEYTWNHTTLHGLKISRDITYLQCLYPHDRLLASVKEMRDLFGDEVLPHLEMIRFGGRVTASALPIVRYTTPERLDEIIALHESRGVMIANPHVVTLEDGSRHKRADADQLGFKHAVDPHGLLNPGKMRTFVPGRAAC